MFHKTAQKIIFLLFICLFFSGTKVLACWCEMLTPQSAVEKSATVFSGEVIGFEYRKGIENPSMKLREKRTGKEIDYETKIVKIRVVRWWKGELPSEVFLITGSTKNSDGTLTISTCDYKFKEGETYLIYASGNQGELKTNYCLRTRKLSEAEEDLKLLGEGKEPLEKKDEPNKSMDARRKQLLSSNVICETLACR